MNLISDPWIPVRRANEAVEKIAPWQITDGIADDQCRITSIASSRPDFDGALVQFLIGLLQTTCTPADVFTWRRRWRQPPLPDELRSLFEAVSFAFDFEGEKAFMQDLKPSELNCELDVAALLIEAPGENTVEQNRDHFIKRGSVKKLCIDCAAMALLALQVNAPTGGKGYRTGLRGGGPLTALILGQTLWETCWQNVLTKARYIGDSEPERTADADRFPWLAATRTSEAKPPAGITTPVDVHPDQQFWTMPRRIRLLAEEDREEAACDLCGSASMRIYRRFRTRNYGVKYEGFEHPLSPHYVKGGTPNPVHLRPGGVGYRHWLGLIENNVEGNNQRRPARVVEQFRSVAREDGRMWAFGYDMENMKARCWYDATMPILNLEGDRGSIFSAHIANMVRVARYVSGLVVSAVLKATTAKPNKNGQEIDWDWPRDLLGKLRRTPTERAEVVKARINEHGEELESRVESGLFTRPLTARADFWAATEAVFFARAAEVRNALLAGTDESEVLRRWRSDMIEAARLVFRNHSQIGDFDASDPRRAALAQLELDYRMNGPRLRDLLGLPGGRHEAERRD